MPYDASRFESITRVSSAYLNSILGQPFNIPSDGFVRVIDYMGDDSSICQSARISYGKGTKSKSDDNDLIRYLICNNHTSPFEQCELKLHVRVTMDIWRQWIRHRTANVNEYSTRYSEAIDDRMTTNPNCWRLQSMTNKQGSSGFVTEYPDGFSNPFEPMAPGAYLTKQETLVQGNARAIYEERLKFGVAREQARKDLPLSTYTEAYWKCDLHNILHFLRLRMDSHAQLEMRNYANIIGEIVKEWVPITWDAFTNYRLESVTFSRDEIAALGLAVPTGDMTRSVKLSKRELDNLDQKSRRVMGVPLINDKQ